MRYSTDGSNNKRKEEAAYAMFLNYLEEIEEGIYACSFVCTCGGSNTEHKPASHPHITLKQRVSYT